MSITISDFSPITRFFTGFAVDITNVMPTTSTLNSRIRSTMPFAVPPPLRKSSTIRHFCLIWLHVQKIPGSHVIIETNGRTPPDRTVTEAMQLAAYYSQARDGQNVPVDYTPVKFVKKPAGAKPGMVIYTTYQTAVVTPDAALCEQLKEKE